MQNVEVTTFNVGQGLFNLVISRKNNGKLYVGVFDCGNFAEYSSTGIEEACGKLNSIEDFETIDQVVISHQDRDHWRNLVDFLLLLNGYTYSVDSWYVLSEEDAYGEYVEALQFSDRFIKHLYRDHEEYLCTALWYEKNEHSCYHWDFVSLQLDILINKGEMSAKWKVDFHTEFEDPFTAEIILKGTTYDIKFTYFDNNFDKKECRSNDISADNLRCIMIDMVSSIACDLNIKIRIYTMWNGIFGCGVFDCKNWAWDFENPLFIRKGIQEAYMGGLCCEMGYSILTTWMNFFAKKVNDKCQFLYNYPDRDKKYGQYPFYLEESIKYPSIKQDHILKNATSQVTMIYMDDSHCLVFPGDATVHVFSTLSRVLTERGGAQVELLLAPHHGSGDTNFCWHKIRGEQARLDEIQPFHNFLSRFPPNYIFISAARDKFGHPSKRFLEACRKYCRGRAERHFVLLGSDTDEAEADYGDGDEYVADYVAGYKLATEKAIFSTESEGTNLIYQYSQRMQDGSMEVCSACLEDPFTESDFAVRSGQKQERKIPSDEMFLPYGGFLV